MKQPKDANLDCCTIIFKTIFMLTFLQVFDLLVLSFTNFDSFTTFKFTISTIKLGTMFVSIAQPIFLIYIPIFLKK
jgi:hypothetical protein